MKGYQKGILAGFFATAIVMGGQGIKEVRFSEEVMNAIDKEGFSEIIETKTKYDGKQCGKVTGFHGSYIAKNSDGGHSWIIACKDSFKEPVIKSTDFKL